MQYLRLRISWGLKNINDPALTIVLENYYFTLRVRLGLGNIKEIRTLNCICIAVFVTIPGKQY